MMSPEPVSLTALPSDIARDWVTLDGRARIEMLPKAEPNDSAAMRRFAQTIVRFAPDAAGTPIQLYQSERTVIRAFVEAGVLAVAAIGIILWEALRRFGDVGAPLHNVGGGAVPACANGPTAAARCPAAATGVGAACAGPRGRTAPTHARRRARRGGVVCSPGPLCPRS